MRDALVVYRDGIARRVPADVAPELAALTGGYVVDIAWDGRRQGPGGPYLSADLHETRPAPGRDPRAKHRYR